MNKTVKLAWRFHQASKKKPTGYYVALNSRSSAYMYVAIDYYRYTTLRVVYLCTMQIASQAFAEYSPVVQP